MIRNILGLFARDVDPPHAVVISRDIDGETDRRRGFEQACDERPWPFVVVAALAQPEIEAWLVTAWDAEDEAEAQRFAAVQRKLGFDPCRASEELTSSPKSPRDAKHVLDRLTETGRSAGERWRAIALGVVEGRGRQNGLATYVEGLRQRVVPLLTGKGT